MNVLNQIITVSENIPTVYKIGDLIEGYYNSSDSKFYSDSSFTTEIQAASGFIYTDLLENKTYRYDDTLQQYVLMNIGGEGGYHSYSDLINKPSIENITLNGNKTASDLGLVKSSDVGTAAAKNSTNAVTANSTALVESGAVYSADKDIYEVMGQNGAKNLLVNNIKSDTYNSLPITKNSDGSITFNGQATSVTNLDFLTSYSAASTENIAHSLEEWGFDKKQKYIITIGHDSYVPCGIRLVYLDSSMNVLGNNYYTITSDSYVLEFTGTFANTAYMKILGYASTSAISDVTIYPMIRLASDIDSTYQPYAMTNREITPYIQAISNPNLLDNPWFTVNQRELTTLAATDAKFFVDRWKIRNATADVVTDGIKITANGSTKYTYFTQYFNISDIKDLLGKTITVSADIKEFVGENFKAYVGLKNTTTLNNNNNGFAQIDFYDSGIITLTTTLPTEFTNSYFTVGFVLQAIDVELPYSGYIIIKSMKLELGSVSTLAMDTVPDYGTELLKCQMSTADASDTYANRNNTGAEIMLEQTVTLSTTDDTTVTFTNSLITANSEIRVLAGRSGGDVQGAKNKFTCSDIYTTTGSCTVTFPKEDSAISLKVRIYIR